MGVTVKMSMLEISTTVNKALIYLFKNHRDQMSQEEIIINVLLSSFRFILIPILWVYGHYNLLFIPARDRL